MADPAAPADPAGPAAARLWAGAIDVVAVTLFVSIGRSAHRHGLSPTGFASTAWPFAVGLATGWAVTGRRRSRPLSVRAGAAVCGTTVAVGMVLRVVAGQGTAASFVAVSVGFLGSLMVGGRLLVRAAARRRGRRPRRA